MSDGQGGYPPNYRRKVQERQAKHSKTLGDLQKSMPPEMIRGNPIDYDDYGIPTNIPDPPTTEQQMQAAMTEGELLQSTPVAQPQRPKPEVPPRAPLNRAALNERGLPPPTVEKQPPPPPPRQTAAEFFGQPQNSNRVDMAPQPSQPVQSQQQPEVEIPLSKKPKHPVLQKLLKRFGLKKAEKYDLEIFADNSVDRTKYTMTLLPDELNTWALAQAQKKAIEIGETAVGVYFEHLVVCSAVVAIDDVPVWRIFELKPESWEAEELVEDQLNLPSRMRKACGVQLAELLWSETRPLTEKLSDFYQNKILNKRKITSSFDEENEGTNRYVCIQDTCAVVELLKPEIFPDGKEQEFFCKLCGGPLVKAANLADEKSVPLG